jgi:hypothetical protein
LSVQVSDDVQALVRELGWSVRQGATPEETVIGDYARGYLVLRMSRYIQVARRSPRGGPSLTFWSPDEDAVQKHLAFALARLVRYRREPGPIAVQAADEGAIADPFRLQKDDQGGVFLMWGGDDEWAGFGAGNEFAAFQFARYGARDVAFAASEGLGAR